MSPSGHEGTPLADVGMIISRSASFMFVPPKWQGQGPTGAQYLRQMTTAGSKVWLLAAVGHALPVEVPRVSSRRI